MNGLFKHGYKFFSAGLIIIFLAIILDYLSQTWFLKLQQKKEYHRIQQEILQDEMLCNSVFDQLEQQNLPSIYDKFEELRYLAAEKNIFIFVLLNDRVILWNTNFVMPGVFNNTANHFTLLQNDNGYYLYMGRTGKFYQFIAMKLIQTNYPFENKYLVNEFLPGKNHKLFKLSTENPYLSDDFQIRNGNKQTLFFLKINFQKQFNSWIILIYFIGALLIFIAINHQINFLISHQKHFQGWLIFVLVLLITVVGWRILRIPATLFQHRIFSPEIYASSRLLSSLGDLFLIVLLLSWLVFILTSHYSFTVSSKKILGNITIFFLYSALLLLLHVATAIVNGLIINSSIPFDMNEFLKFNNYTFISYLIIFLIIFTFIRITRFFVKSIKNNRINNLNWVIIILITSGIYLIIFFKLNHLLFNPVFLLAVWLILLFTEKSEGKNMAIALTLIFISSAFIAHLIIHSVKIREVEKKKLLVNQIISGRDALTEYLLNDITGKIENDNYLFSFFTNPLISQKMLKRRIKQVYFSGYFANYDFDLKTFTPGGKSFKDTDTSDITVFDSILKVSLPVNNSGTQYFYNSFESNPIYLLKIEVKRGEILYGRIIILLKRKSFLEESIFPDLVVEKDITKMDELKQYSYAIYSNNNLISQKGNYFYPTRLVFRKHKNPYQVYREGDYEHLCYHHREDLVVIISHPVPDIYASLALASFLFFISSVLFAVLFYVYLVITQYVRRPDNRKVSYFSPFSNISFKAKIQMIIMFSVLVAVFISGYLTINNLIQNLSKANEKKILQEISLVADKLNEYFTDQDETLNNLDEIVNESSAQFRTDINVYNPDGILIGSSQMPVFERKILSKVINPEAYYQLKIQKRSAILLKETFNKKLQYASAYVVLTDANNNLAGFVNIPYYSRLSSERSEITSLIVNLVNLYVFLLLLILFISISISGTFTQPLEIISTHLRDLKLGKGNKKIEWSSQDEIGRLISEYNKMVENVEKSAIALSRTERESAWREMAQQVAHEIKNPLTPMKLSLQRLLLSWNNRDPDVEVRFRKTIEVLIGQIDNLSQIATEFSEFARMPEPVLEVVLLQDCLNEVVDLYKAVERVEINVENHDKDLLIYVDPGQLKRAFNNLIKNAIQAIPADRKGKIQINVIRNASIVLISIADNGIGIKPELQDKIFLPSFSTKSSGMGLGLAIVSKIIKSFNGQIWFDTIANEGTTFYISLPVIENITEKDERTEKV